VREERLLERREREAREAAQWAAKHGGGDLPGRRSETGETDTPQPVRRSKGKPGFTPDGELPREHRDPVSYSAFGTIEEFEDALIESGTSYRPLVTHSMPGINIEDSLSRLGKASQLHHCLSFLEKDRVDLLFKRHVERMTLDAIAGEEGVSRQAIIKRLRTAEKHLRDAITEHWDDEVTWEL
jgi:hypothetical protein